jgi:hypothetical protein
MRYYKFTVRFDDFRFPLRLALVVAIAMPFVSFQGDYFQIVDALIIEGFGVKANFL